MPLQKLSLFGPKIANLGAAHRFLKGGPLQRDSLLPLIHDVDFVALLGTEDVPHLDLVVYLGNQPR